MKKIASLPVVEGRELDITQVHKLYLAENAIRCVVMPEGTYYNNVTHPADVEAASLWLSSQGI